LQKKRRLPNATIMRRYTTVFFIIVFPSARYAFS
jgi:hypothetical protein